MTDHVPELLRHLQQVKPTAHGWRTKCPCHNPDAHPSLDVKADGDKLLLTCRACGANGARVVEALGLPQTMLNLGGEHRNATVRPPKAEKPPRTYAKLEQAEEAAVDIVRREHPDARHVRTFVYHNAAGGEHAGAVRVEFAGGKQYLPLRRVPGGWQVKFPEHRLLYNLPAILEQPDAHVVVVEGEKAAEALRCVPGVVATTSMGGCKAASKTDWTPLAGRRVDLWPDSDDDGEGYIRDDASILQKLQPPAQVSIIRWREAPPKGDAYDWSELHESAEPDQLRELLDQLPREPVAAAPAERGKMRLLSSYDIGQLPKRPYRLKGVAAVGEFGVLFGPWSAFKSFLATAFAVAVAEGRPLFLGRKVAPGLVAILAGEGAGGLPHRLRAAIGVARMNDPADPIHKRLWVAPAMPALTDPTGFAAAVEALQALPEPPGMLVVDTWHRQLSACGIDENSSGEVGELIVACDRLRAQFPVATMLAVHHSGAANLERERGSTALPAAADFRLQMERVGGPDSLQARLTYRKVKDGAVPKSVILSFGEAVVGVDEDGDNETSLFLSGFREESPDESPANERDKDLANVLQILQAGPRQAEPDLVNAMGCARSTAFDRLKKWAKQGKLRKDGNLYSLPLVEAVR